MKNARSYIAVEEAKVEDMLRQLGTDRRIAREERMAIEADRLKTEKDCRQYEEELAKSKREREEVLR